LGTELIIESLSPNKPHSKLSKPILFNNAYLVAYGGPMPIAVGQSQKCRVGNET